MLSQSEFNHKYAGTVIEGTHNTGALIHALRETLKALVKDEAKGVSSNDEEFIAHYLFLDWSDESNEAEFYLEDLFARLDYIANEYDYYFGYHPDDGACFGFWRFENAI